MLGNIEAWRKSGSLEAVLALAKLNDVDRIQTNCTQVAAFYSPPIAHRPLPIDPEPWKRASIEQSGPSNRLSNTQWQFYEGRCGLRSSPPHLSTPKTGYTYPLQSGDKIHSEVAGADSDELVLAIAT